MSSSPYSSPEITSATHTDPSQGRFSTMYETQEDVLEDLSSRFILNLPDEELNSIERISFQVEQAHWYYEDFVREANPKLPSLPLKKFSAMLFAACPLLHRWEDHEQAFTDFMQYKTRVPVCGAIMLNDTWEKCILVKGWKSSSGWGFPKGKINENEPQASCAVREVLEETGYNLAGQLNPDHVIEMSIKEQRIALFIAPGVPEDYPFKTKTRKEISKIEWFRLADLPTWKRNKTAPGKFYLITPFIGPLKQFIREHKPTAVPRKPPRAKKHNNESRPASRHQRSPANSPSTSSQEANQESSSQSSSADNGDPQTPSPQVILTAANHVDIASSSVDTEALDPHFARLLSGLTLSGVAAATQKNGAQKSPVAQPLLSPLSDLSTSHAQMMSSPIPSTSPAVGSGKTSDTPADQTSQTHPKNPLPVTLPTTSYTTSTAPQDPPVSSPSTSTSPVRSFRGASSRRTSSTADISPYLSKTTEIPSSAKRLKQIALLEAVATESARMSPILQMRDVAVNNVVKDHAARYSHPTASVSSSTVGSHDRHHVLYSSAAPTGIPGMPPPPVMNNLNHSSLLDDPFVVRPRTSQAVHRAPYSNVPNVPGSMSMTHSQLSTLMNLHGHTLQMPPSQPHFRFPPAMPSSPAYTPFAAPPSRDGHFPSQFPFAAQQHRSLLVPPHPTGSVPLPLQVPMSAPALSPMFDITPQASSAIPGNPLLSILNGNLNGTPRAPLPGTAFPGPV